MAGQTRAMGAPVRPRDDEADRRSDRKGWSEDKDGGPIEKEKKGRGKASDVGREPVEELKPVTKNETSRGLAQGPTTATTSAVVVERKRPDALVHETDRADG